MKGIELPINVLIIIAIAVIVLIALVAMFYPTFTSGGTSVSLETAKEQACRAELQGNNCGLTTGKIGVYNFDANKDGKLIVSLGAFPATAVCDKTGGDNLARLCICYYQIYDDTNCKRLCGCQV